METRKQGLGIHTTICSLIGVLVVLQLWLLASSLEAYLAGEKGVAWPATFASIALLVVNGGLLAYALGFDRRLAIRTARVDHLPGKSHDIR